MLFAVEGREPAGIETALASEIGDDGRQQGVEMVAGGKGQVDDAHAVEQRAGQTGHAVGGGQVADLAEVDVGLKKGVRVANAGLGLQKVQQTIPEPASIGTVASAGLVQLI